MTEKEILKKQSYTCDNCFKNNWSYYTVNYEDYSEEILLVCNTKKCPRKILLAHGKTVSKWIVTVQ